jgi:hypothetical protein
MDIDENDEYLSDEYEFIDHETQEEREYRLIEECYYGLYEESDVNISLINYMTLSEFFEMIKTAIT